MLQIQKEKKTVMFQLLIYMYEMYEAVNGHKKTCFYKQVFLCASFVIS